MNKNILIILAVVVGLGAFVLRGSSVGQEESGENQVKRVDPIEFSKLIEDEGSFLLDVHIPEQSHIPGTDAFVPYNEIGVNVDKLPENKSTPILVYCRSGSMSRAASEELVGLGYTNVYDLEGGIAAYREANTYVRTSPSVIDLGTVVYGEVASASFILSNYTGNDLKIERVSTSCSCTSASMDVDEIEAYGEAEVRVTFDPAVHKDDTDLGDITRTIYIDTDNPNFKQITATINANVIKQ